MQKRRRNFKEILKQLSYDRPAIDQQAVNIWKSFEEVKKTLSPDRKKKETKDKKK